MTTWQAYTIGRRAEADAARGVYQPEVVAEASFGFARRFDPGNDLEHVHVAQDLNRHVEMAEYAHDIQQREDELAEYPSVVGLTVFVALLFVVEVIGTTLVMRTVGYENPERLVLGAMLAAFLIFLTSATARMPKNGWFAVVLIAYVTVVLSMATLRSDEMAASEDGSQAVDWATSVVLLCTTTGVAWLAEATLRKREPAVRLAKSIRHLRRRLRRSERAKRRAQRFVTRFAQVERERAADLRQGAAIYRQASIRAGGQTAWRDRTPHDGSPSTCPSATDDLDDVAVQEGVEDGSRGTRVA